MNKRIFIIEDDVNILYGLQAKFSADGFVVFINNGRDGLKSITDQIKIAKVDLIILDLLLPEVDGFELLTAMKADSIISHLPVFVFTNLSDKDTKEKCEKLGADYFFMKSDFNIDNFITKIKKY